MDGSGPLRVEIWPLFEVGFLPLAGLICSGEQAAEGEGEVSVKRPLLILLIVSLLAVLPASVQALPAKEWQYCDDGPCPSCHKEEGSSATWTPPEGTEVEYVVVKAGNKEFQLDVPGADGCYTVSVNGRTVTVARTGTPGPQCKEISHTRFYYKCGSPPPPPPPPPPGCPALQVNLEFDRQVGWWLIFKAIVRNVGETTATGLMAFGELEEGAELTLGYGPAVSFLPGLAPGESWSCELIVLLNWELWGKPGQCIAPRLSVHGGTECEPAVDDASFCVDQLPDTPVSRQDFGVQVEAGWAGIPVKAWVGGTEQETLYTAVDGVNPVDFSVHWTFYNHQGSPVAVEVQTPPGKDPAKWYYIRWDNPSLGVFSYTNRAELTLGVDRVAHFQLLCRDDPHHDEYIAQLNAYRAKMASQ